MPLTYGSIPFKQICIDILKGRIISNRRKLAYTKFLNLFPREYHSHIKTSNTITLKIFSLMKINSDKETNIATKRKIFFFKKLLIFSKIDYS